MTRTNTTERPKTTLTPQRPAPAASRPVRPRLGLWRCPIARAAAIEVLG